VKLGQYFAERVESLSRVRNDRAQERSKKNDDNLTATGPAIANKATFSILASFIFFRSCSGKAKQSVDCGAKKNGTLEKLVLQTKRLYFLLILGS
jgi:hypothetical protein